MSDHNVRRNPRDVTPPPQLVAARQKHRGRRPHMTPRIAQVHKGLVEDGRSELLVRRRLSMDIDERNRWGFHRGIASRYAPPE